MNNKLPTFTVLLFSMLVLSRTLLFLPSPFHIYTAKLYNHIEVIYKTIKSSFPIYIKHAKQRGKHFKHLGLFSELNIQSKPFKFHTCGCRIRQVKLWKWVLTDICAISVTVLDMNQKPTRPPPRKFKLTTKPPVTSSNVKPTTTTASVSTTTSTTATSSRVEPLTTAASVTTTASNTVVKLKWKSFDKKDRKENKLKPWRKKKKLNKQAANTQKKKQKSKEQKENSKKTAAVQPVSAKVKPMKTNETATADIQSNTLQTPKSLRDPHKVLTKKTPQRKAAQKQTVPGKNSIKVKESAKEYHAFVNKTVTNLNVETNRTMQNKLQVKRKRAKNAKAL